MEAAIRALLPRVLGDLSFDVYPHRCKDDLLSKLPKRLKGYSVWLPSDWRIIVVLDRDDDDCHALKRRMERIAEGACLRTRTASRGALYHLVNRIAIEELEAWYFGDWAAVRAAYPRVPETIPRIAAYRDPDAIRGGTWEAFERVLQQAGYFRGGLRKIEAAKAIAPHWSIDMNESGSFRVLRDVVREIAAL